MYKLFTRQILSVKVIYFYVHRTRRKQRKEKKEFKGMKNNKRRMSIRERKETLFIEKIKNHFSK